MNSKPNTVKPEVKSGMKASTSAPSRLPSAKAPQKDSLFDEDDDDDLFAATKETRFVKSFSLCNICNIFSQIFKEYLD